MLRALSVAVLATLSACTSSGPVRVHPVISRSVLPLVQAEVVRVIDGDTFVAMVGADEERIRLIGIDTPERGEPNGPRATAAVKAQIREGAPVYLMYDVDRRDRYGRLLAYVWLFPPQDRADTSKMLNATIMKVGWARTMTIPPNVAYADLFLRLQREARAAKRGMWAIEPFGDPS